MPVTFISAEMTGVAVGLVIYFLGASWQVAVAGGVIGAAVGYWIGRTVVCTENSNPNVLVMKSAQDGVRSDDAGSLNRARDRRIFVQ